MPMVLGYIVAVTINTFHGHNTNQVCNVATIQLSTGAFSSIDSQVHCLPLLHNLARTMSVRVHA